LENIFVTEPTDVRIQLILDRIGDLEDKINELDAKATKQLKSSDFDFRAYLGVAVGAIALIGVLGLSVNYQEGKTQVSYEPNNFVKIVLAVLSTGSAVWGFSQHTRAKKEREN
jgi:hypothetical protein